MNKAPSLFGSQVNSELATPALHRELREQLLALNFHAFAACMAHLLQKMGYAGVQLTGRTDWRGHNRGVGFDIEASLPQVLGAPRRVIVQVKQFDTQIVYQRSIDELRGTCLRVGASEALLLTTGSFASSAEHRAKHLPGASIAPVRLVDGDELLDLLITHRVGVWEEAGESANEPARYGIDTDFFKELSRTHVGNSRHECIGNASTEFLVSVSVQPVKTRVATNISTKAQTVNLVLR